MGREERIWCPFCLNIVENKNVFTDGWIKYWSDYLDLWMKYVPWLQSMR